MGVSLAIGITTVIFDFLPVITSTIESLKIKDCLKKSFNERSIFTFFFSSSLN